MRVLRTIKVLEWFLEIIKNAWSANHVNGEQKEILALSLELGRTSF